MISEDIRMDFGMKKCTMLVINKGKTKQQMDLNFQTRKKWLMGKKLRNIWLLLETDTMK